MRIVDGVVSLLKGELNGTDQSAYTAKLAAVTAVTGSSVFANELPRGFGLPGMCVHRYGASQDYDLQGPIELREDQIQIDIYEDPKAPNSGLVYDAVRSLLDGYVGTLPDGSVVNLIKFERGMDMPFLAKADQKATANRSLLGFRVITTV